MPELPIVVDVLRRSRRSLALWSLALALVSAIYIGFYPSMGGDSLDDLVDALPEELVTAFGYDQFGSAAGWITGTVYGLLGPVLLLVYAIGSGAGLIAGEEEAGTLELDLTAPVSRNRLLLARIASLVISIGALVVVVAAVTWLLIVALSLDVSFGSMVAASTGLFLLIVGFGSLALAVGAMTGRRSVALGIAAVAAGAAFIFDALGPVVDVSWMSSVSPFFWYLGGDPLASGFDGPGLAKLLAVPVAAVGFALMAFPRRELQV